MFKRINIALAVLILASCTTVSIIPIGEANYGPHNEKVIVYANRGNIDKEFEEIAIITAKTDEEFGIIDDNATMNKILDKAKTIGAHAVIFEEEDLSATMQSMRVTAIRFTE